MINYISYNQMFDDIRNNLGRLPRADLVLSIPRSGLVPAAVITKFLNVNTMTINKFCDIVENSEDIQEALHKELVKSDFSVVFQAKEIKNILVVDDTVYSGRQIEKWSERVHGDCFKEFDIIFLTIYKEWNVSGDIFLVDLFPVTKDSIIKSSLYEWTIWNRRDLMPYIAFDLDGVFCVDPPDDHDTEAYENYLQHPIPLYTPVLNKGYSTNVITYRIEKYRDVTSKFLANRGIECTLYMVGCDTREERNSTCNPAVYKTAVLKTLNVVLYVESNDWEAQAIHQLWGKPVLCIQTNKIYQ